MYELNFYDKQTEQCVCDFELTELSESDVVRIFGFSLEGNCCDVSLAQLSQIEKCVGQTFNVEGCDISLCEVIDS